MGLNARAKGARGEREVKDLFIELMAGVEALFPSAPRHSAGVLRNAMQSAIGGDDLVGIPGLSVEVKFCETLLLRQWWQQCCGQATQRQLMPVLIYRQSRRPWRVMTYSQLTNGSVHKWVVSDLSIDEFLDWYKSVYHSKLHGFTT